jgi:hypothetical protein
MRMGLCNVCKVEFCSEITSRASFVKVKTASEKIGWAGFEVVD